MPGPVAAEPSITRLHYFAVDHQTDIERRTAGVADDDVSAQPLDVGEGTSRHGCHGRTRFCSVDGPLNDVRNCDAAAHGGRDQQFSTVASLAQVALEFAEMALHQRLQRSINAGCRCATVFAE